jgi:predicted aspartyl protease
VKGRFRYDLTFDQPAPVVPLWVAAPGSRDGAVIPVILDSGADCTLVPQAVARALRLPAIDEIWIEGVGGTARRARVHAARVQLAQLRRLARVVGFGREAVLGRDLLNQLVARLDGPALELSFRR